MEIRNIHLRRAYWAIFSKPLLQMPYTAQYVRDEVHLRHLLKLFARLDQNPITVDAHFESLGNLPMGKYFEQLLFFVLHHDDRFEILLQNHQVIEDKTTVGEIDLILKDLVSGQVEHWEIALKFYLQSKISEKHSAMVGPNAMDNLHRKMKKLKNHQLALARHPAVKDSIPEISGDSKVFLKGLFFYHLNQKTITPKNIHPDHCSAWWCFVSESKDMLKPNLSWITIEKPNWIGPIRLEGNSGAHSHIAMLSKLEAHFSENNKTVCIVGLERMDDGWTENTRGFIAQNDWPNHSSS